MKRALAILSDGKELKWLYVEDLPDEGTIEDLIRAATLEEGLPAVSTVWSENRGSIELSDAVEEDCMFLVFTDMPEVVFADEDDLDEDDEKDLDDELEDNKNEDETDEVPAGDKDDEERPA